MTVDRVTAWCQDVDKNGNWREVRSDRRQLRASAVSQEREDKGSAGGGGDCNNRGGGALQPDASKGPPRTKEEAEAQTDSFYVRDFMSDRRIEKALIMRDKLCPLCGGVERPAAGQQKCSGSKHCRFLEKLGLVVRDASSASPADGGDSGSGGDDNVQANATVPLRPGCWTTRCLARSPAPATSGRVSFAPADGLPLVSYTTLVSLPPLVAALLASPPDHASPLSATPRR